MQMNNMAQAAYSFHAADARADRGERRVVVEHDRICIARRYQGMQMRIAVPVQAFRGVALSLQPRTDGGAFYQVTLVHDDADLSVVLEQALDDRNIFADWTRWSQYFEQARLVERAPGQFEEMDHRVGAVAQGEAQAVRRTSVTRQRRGRFLARRKTGDAGRSAVQFGGEREIVCYE